MKIKETFNLMKKTKSLIILLGAHNIIKLPDKLYLELLYERKFGKKLNLKNPQTFNEKLQWLKLYDRNPEYTKMVDKYEAKRHVASIIGAEYIIPTLGIWEKFDDIDFNKLPNQFVLKCTHDSGGLIICKDKTKLDIKEAKRTIEKSLKRNFYYYGREWPYKNVKPRIIAEQYMENNDGTAINDYKFYCFNGTTDYVLMCMDRIIGETKFFFLDREGQLMRDFTKDSIKYGDKLNIETINNLDEMFKIAEKLSNGLKFIRVDLYNINGKIYFGELTFYPNSGMDNNRLEITDIEFSKRLNLCVEDENIRK